MLSILGSLLGFAGSAVPAITDHFAAKEDATRSSSPRLHWALNLDLFSHSLALGSRKSAASSADHPVKIEPHYARWRA